MLPGGERGELGEPGRLALYFCGSIRGGREDRALYERIVTRLRRFGTVLTEHVAAAELDQRGELPAPGARPPTPEFHPAPCGRRKWGGLGLPGSQQACGWEEAAGDDRLIHERDLAWLQQADAVVAEVTQPSLGVGYELGRAVALNKRILCLFRPQSGRVLSAMIRGAADGSRIQVWDYEEGEVEALLDRYFEADPPGQVAASPDPTT
uniref:2'-deoxynucleoside 5'-phosphate N-hydrolase 1 n=1 Tax=Cebus imitator TaxID=2715852 RepID=A0A2K5PUN7_CEBIM